MYNREKDLRDRRTKNGLTYNIYKNQIKNSKARGHQPPLYTLEELRLWFWAQPNAEFLYEDWMICGYPTKLRPSVDRLDDYKGYSLDNIQLITFGENQRKPSPTAGRNIVQFSKEMEQIRVFNTGAEAARHISGYGSNIHAVCNGKSKTYKGFIWRYE